MLELKVLLANILAQAEPAAAGSSGIQINPLIIFWQIVAFLILLYLMNRFAFGPILKVIDERRSRIEESIANAEQIKKDLAAAQQNSQNILTEARVQAQQNIANAQKQSETIIAQSRVAAQEQGNQLLTRAQQEINAQKEQAKGELRQEVANLAIMAASKVVRRNLDGQEQYRLVDEALQEAEQSNNGNAALRGGA